jgi:two-component system cell cycle sensor histidine kinase/response regulator CckA
MTAGGRVLVIDDDAAMGRVIRRLLRRFDVTVCSTVDAARVLLLGHDFDVVISDVQLDYDSGLDLFDEIVRERPELRSRYLFISGAATEPAIRVRLEGTGAPYLRKPFDVDELRNLVSVLVSQRPLED